MKGEVQLEPSSERNPSDSDPLLENKANTSTGSSSEIKDEEIEPFSAACCRICLEYDGEAGAIHFPIIESNQLQHNIIRLLK
uniref:Uncharacterized protein n=1 Tax=Nelumbo nucifera TaxID=4432 RepID=A0A822Y7A8_NELNU|nr:TPA_asm: hypothetical protein HUJ06_028534 [Nelumbo nucifera]